MDHSRAGALQPRHAHVVYPEARVRSFVSKLLGQEGYDVSEAAHGAATVTLLAHRMLHGMPAPHLIVAGLRLRGFSGIELLHGLRASDWAAPVLLIARPGDEQLLSDGERLGAHAILRWPFAIEAFRDAVRDLCSVDDWPPALLVDQPIEIRAGA